MAESPSAWVEVLKYPAAVLSIFLALLGAKYLLGIPFGAVTEITKDGIKFTQEARGELASLSAQLNAAQRSIDELKKQVATTPLSHEAKAEIFEASQTVSDQTAQVATVRAAAGDGEQVGYIWIGDYSRGTATWQRVKLVSPTTNSAVTMAPAAITPGAVYAVSGNMVLRDGLPRNDGDYFQGRRSLGVLPVGTRVKVLAAPVAIDREFAVQYWLQVAVQSQSDGS